MTTSTIPTPRVPARTPRRVVRERLRFELLDEATRPTGSANGSDRNPISVRGLLRWASADPHAVELVFRPGTATEVVWVIGRDLLTDGVAGPAGLGDVSILPDLRSGTRRELVLSSPTGRRGFRFPVAGLVAFLDRVRTAEGGAA